MSWIKKAKVGKKEDDKIIKLLDMLDGYGIVFTDDDMVRERLQEIDLEWLFSK